MSSKSQFPFHYLKYPTKDGVCFETPFIEQVKVALDTDLQKHDSFGCRIKNCHTHAGSKIHFEDFIEAELLFHNNYYNVHFAQLTLGKIKHIIQKNKLNKKLFKNLLVIGYEKYSELYLQELMKAINFEIENHNIDLENCSYCVYETNSRNTNNKTRVQEVTIKYLAPSENKNSIQNHFQILYGTNHTLAIEDTICIFIVPINTSLSTMDKMVAKFCADTNAKNFAREHICLITLGPNLSVNNNLLNDDGNYWKINDDGSKLIPHKERFEYINENTPIENIVLFETDWEIVNHCKKCFPDVNNNGKLEDEEPMFGVNRGSVVPMLKVGQKKYLAPINKANHFNLKKNNNINNLNRIWQLSKYMSYGHVVRSDNHFQYYFFTDKYLQSYSKDVIGNFFPVVKKELKNDRINDGSTIIFDFIVAPRHRTNAKWVHLVNNYIFDGQARIMYFDPDKEYRSNIVSKYSDLASTLDNIRHSKQKFYIRFHFVDDTINSGATYLRAKNLVTSLCGDINDDRISLFNSIILLVNRLSSDTQHFYISNGRFFKYVDINISSMRRHDDACTLCKIIYDYDRIKNECATNKLAKICLDVISRHSENDALEIEKNINTSKVFSELEKRYMFFISHLLSERISNKLVLLLPNASREAIDAENDEVEVKEILELLYDTKNIKTLIRKYCNLTEETTNSNFNTNLDGLLDINLNIFIWKIALIKVISRPFFIYHIRQRQASFSFCVEKLNNLLQDSIDEFQGMVDNRNDYIFKRIPQAVYISIMIQTLVKALSDMNSNYLLRKKTLEKLVDRARYGDNLYIKCENICDKKLREYIKKRLFTQDALLHYLKKDIVLSRDASKSLLLEYVLLTNSEDSFFNKSISPKALSNNVFTCSKENDILGINIYGSLYFENNTIIKDILGNDGNLEKLCALAESEACDSIYFLGYFLEICKLNSGWSDERSVLKSYKDAFVAYRELINQINRFKDDKNKVDLSIFIDMFLIKLLGTEELRTQVFIRDKMESNKLFQFFTLAGNPAEDKRPFPCKFPQLTPTQAFYYDENLDTIRKIIDSIPDWTIYFIKDHLKFNNKNLLSAVIKFCSTSSNNNIDESVYIQIWGIDMDKPIHRFALKLLTTLRKNIIDLINNINLQELIEERKVDMQKNALSINKATTHADSEKYFKEMIYSDYPDKLLDGTIVDNEYSNLPCSIDWHTPFRNQYAKVIAISKKDYEFMLYDTYYELLSDEFISNVYRGIINGERLFQCDMNKINYNRLKHIVWQHFCSDTSNTGNNDYFENELYAIKEGKKAKLRFIFESSNSNDMRCNAWASVTSINSIFYIINLIAMNVVQHGDANTDYYNINIYFNDNAIVFKSLILNGDPDLIQKYVQMYTHIPPWLFKENHITLWTLVQSELVDQKSKQEDKIKVKIKATKDTNEFVVELRLFSKGDSLNENNCL